MQIRVSSSGKGLVALEPMEAFGFGPGDVADVTVKAVLARRSEPADSDRQARVIVDPRTGLPALTLGEGAPEVSSEVVAEILADFP